MKFTFFMLTVLLCPFLGFADSPQDEVRGKIGSTFGGPVQKSGSYYFVSTAGVLFEANSDFSKVDKLFEGKRQTLGKLIEYQGKIIWGDGVHQDNKSNLHIFDLSKKTMEATIEIEGHIERPPLISDNKILVPAGPGGITAIDLKTHKILWQTKQYKDKPIHVDSNLVQAGAKVCGTTVYGTKGVLCFDPNTGSILQFAPLNRDPKSEITLWKNHVVGFATEADLMQTKFDIPSQFFVYDVNGNKMKHNKELRGFNFFAPSISENGAFITLSTGDFIIFDLDSGKIEFLGEFPEPFINNSFRKGNAYCGIGIMGKYMCYNTKAKSGHTLETDKRLLETVIGEITFNGKLIAPSRIGYYVE